MVTTRALPLFLALSVLMFAVVSCDRRAEFEDKFKQCMEESKVTHEEVKSFFSRGMPAGEATEPIKCHMKCIMEKEGIFKDGVYNDELALQSLMEMPHLQAHKAEVEKALKDCKDEKGTNDCDTAYVISACVKDHEAKFKTA